MIAVERIDRKGDFLSLAKDWDDLEKRAAAADVFVSHDWISVWSDHFGNGRELRFLVQKGGSGLDGIAPLVLAKESWRGLPVRILRFPIDPSVGIARCGFLLGNDPGRRIGAFLDHLCAGRDWDVLHLEGFPSDSPHLDLLAAAAAERGLPVSPRCVAQVARYVAIDTDWEGYLRGKSGHFRKHLSQEGKKLEKFGRVSFSLHRDPDEVAEAMPRVMSILSARMGIRSIDEASAQDRRLIRFAADLAARFSRKGALEIRLLNIDDRPAACLLSVVRDAVVFTILTKYDPAFEAASPGRAMFRYLLRDAAVRGYREIDFLSTWSYLERFTPTTRTYMGIRIYNKGLYPGLVRLGRERLARLARETGFLRGNRGRPGPEHGGDAGGKDDERR